ncbi:flagellar brake domain-containing protein [Bacillus siamensis]|uniref:flagellar brake protein n=1 Tax=Bacillus siamensis TaxID=659243 RepID=UPI0022B7B867|nr:flagellar brake domain-containing protein [Bacillus siamensis]MDU0811691.1 flagellar brake domain-containing protein [Bacillus siamensis]MED5049674.1 flagellar brake domain-containing protein [Bacillus siamensis]MED5097816.1 flagellar brake domain-containing protein [Bacillus siamensis]
MIAVGDYIWIEYIENNEFKKARSKAVSIESGELYISYPVDLDTGRTVFLHKGLEITAEFMGNGQVPYQFKTIIKGKKKDPIPMIGLDIPPKEEMKRIQRRRYVRADAVLDVAVKMEAEKTAFQTVSSNMSAGGIAVVLPEHISAEPGEKLHVSFSLAEKENTADITAEAVTQRVFYDEKAAKRKMTLEFTDIDPASQQHILRYCMRAQLQQRRNRQPE